MNRKAVDLWINALKSGEYTQGTKVLNKDNQFFCCLGVACEIYQQEVGGLAVFRDDEGTINYNDRRTVLPDAVEEWLQLRHSDGGFDEDSLAVMNDTGCSFDEIADMIESNPRGLFIED